MKILNTMEFGFSDYFIQFSPSKKAELPSSKETGVVLKTSDSL